MSGVTGNAILLGFAFNVAGLLKSLCDRWQPTLVVEGYPTRKKHAFNHLFFLWFIMQFLQMCMYFVWYAIEWDKFGFGRLKHGDIKQRGNERYPVLYGGSLYAGQDANQGAAHADGGAEEEFPQGGPGHLQLDQSGEASETSDQQALLGESYSSQTDGQDNDTKRTRPLRKYTKLLYFPPALFDVASVLMLYFGAKLTYSSSFIMLKGTIGVYGALLSMAFLAQPVAPYVWFGVVFTMLGFGALGVSDYVHESPPGYEKYGIAAGDLLMAMSFIMFATKLIYEEKFMRKHSIHPMRFLGAEGFYGFFFATILFLVFNFVHASQYSELPNSNVEDVRDAFWQMAADWRVPLAVSGSIVMFIVYRYLGMFLVRDYGALPRMMIELLMWAVFGGVCLLLGWEQFYIVEVPGFVVILIGQLIYARILVMPRLCQLSSEDSIGEDQLDLGQDNFDEEDDGEPWAGVRRGRGEEAAAAMAGGASDEEEDESLLPVGDGAAEVRGGDDAMLEA